MRRRSLLCSLVVCASAVFLATASMQAQGDSASMLGSVRDTQGGAIPAVVMTLRNTDTGFTRTATADDAGSYRFTAVPPGPYSLTAAKPGFGTIVRDGVILVLGAEAVINMELPVAGLSESLVVTADVPVVETTKSAIEMRLNREQLDILPTFFRDYTSFMRLTPASQAFGSSFTGSRDRSNEFVLDGVDNTSDISGFSRSFVTLDTIQEFEVLANNYKAEFGRASGGVVNVITRAGTNRQSGSALFAISDDAFNSLSPYANRLVPEPPFRRTTFGGNIGGPFVRDRWHYFVSYE
jgi:hypothetical protein